jgi:hypothetical protein
MGSRKRRRETAQSAGNHDGGAPSPVRFVRLGRERSGDQAVGEHDPAGAFEAEQVSDWIASTADSGPVLGLHVIWFGAWVP